MPSIFALQCQCNDPHSKHEKPALTATAIRALVTVTTKRKSHQTSSFLQSNLDKRGRCRDTRTYLSVYRFRGSSGRKMQAMTLQGYPPPALSGTILMLEQLCKLQNTVHSTELPVRIIFIYFKSEGFFLVDFLRCA